MSSSGSQALSDRDREALERIAAVRGEAGRVLQSRAPGGAA